MIFLAILPILSILGVGLLANSIITKFTNHSFTYDEIILNSNVYGFSLLVFPLIFFGLGDNTIDFSFVTKIFGIIGLIAFIFYFYKFLKLFIENLEVLSKFLNRNDQIYIYLTLIAISIYLLYSILLPLRGYDSLWMYFPNSLLYFQTSSIPELNFFNFMPTVKEPFNSLLYTYTLYITGDWSIELIPFYFIMLWGFLTYKLSYLLIKDRRLSILSMLMFFFFPGNIWFIDNWPYYQDIFLGFFFTLTIYYFLKSQNTKSTNFYTILAGLALALALISKISGWTLFLILPLLLKVNKKQKILIIFYAILLFSFLIFQGIFRIYIGILPVFIMLLLFLVAHIWYYKSETENRFNLIKLGFIYIIGIIIGSYWLIQSLERVSALSTFLLDQYLNLSDLIKWEYVPPEELRWIFEHAHSITFESIILILIISNLFGLFFALPKLRSLLHFGDTSPLVIWTLSFFAIWIVYHSTASFRYLTPIFTPIVILSVKGIQLLYLSIVEKSKNESNNNVEAEEIDTDYFQENRFFRKSIIIILFFSIISLYIPIIPSIDSSGLDVNNIGLSYIKNAFYYYSNWLFIIIVVLIIPLLVLLYINYKISFNQLQNYIDTLFSKIITKKVIYSLIVLIIIIPTFVPMSVFTISNGNLMVFQETYVFENRREYKEVIAHIISENNPRGGIITFNTPGLSIWTLQPSLDVFLQFDILRPFLTDYSVSKGLEFLKNPTNNLLVNGNQIDTNINFTYLMIPNYKNYFYPLFIENFRYKTYLYSMLENQYYFKEIYKNTEFRLFRTIFRDTDFLGPYDIFLVGKESKTSAFGDSLIATSYKTPTTIEIPIDVSLIKNSSVNISLQIDYEINHTIKSETSSVNYNFISNNFITLTYDFGAFDSLKVFNVTTTLSYQDANGHVINKKVRFFSISGINIYKIDSIYQIDPNSSFDLLYE